MSTRLFALGLLMATVPQTPSVTESEDILRAVVAHIQMRPEDRIIAGLNLDSANPAFQGLHANRGRFGRPDEINLISRDRVVVEDVTVNGPSATVVLTYGPVPATQRLDCGQVLMIPLLRRSPSRWEVDEGGIWLKCRNEPPPGMSAEDAQLLEAIRLVVSGGSWTQSQRAVAGPKLSPQARRLISQLVPLKEADEVGDSEFVLPRDHVRFSVVQFTEAEASIELTAGPIPRHATLACGSTFKYRLRRRSAGWFIDSSSLTVC